MGRLGVTQTNFGFGNAAKGKGECDLRPNGSQSDLRRIASQLPEIVSWPMLVYCMPNSHANKVEECKLPA